MPKGTAFTRSIAVIPHIDQRDIDAGLDPRFCAACRVNLNDAGASVSAVFCPPCAKGRIAVSRRLFDRALRARPDYRAMRHARYLRAKARRAAAHTA